MGTNYTPQDIENMDENEVTLMRRAGIAYTHYIQWNTRKGAKRGR